MCRPTGKHVHRGLAGQRSTSFHLVGNFIYCRSGNIREVLIFANFVGGGNSRIQDSRENYYYNRATKKSQNQKFAKIETREIYQIDSF